MTSSAGSACRAPAACWCARTTVESALTVQSVPLGLIAPGPQPAQDLLPGPVQRPAAMPVIDGLPVPVPLRQVPPRAAGPGPEQDPVDHHPVIVPPAPLPAHRAGIIGSSRCHSSSVRSCRFRRSSTRTDLHQADPKIYGTRPSAQFWHPPTTNPQLTAPTPRSTPESGRSQVLDGTWEAPTATTGRGLLDANHRRVPGQYELGS